MKIDVYTLNAFAEEPHGGNPAGVVVNADSLSDEVMQKIATKIGFSETAFVMKSDCADFRVRFFTPTEEVDFCGHATVGTFFLLHHLGMIENKKYLQETKAGILSVEVRENGLVEMQQAPPRFHEKLTKRDADFAKVCESLGITTEDIGVHPIVDGSPQEQLINHMEVVSTGLRDLMVPLRSVEVLNHLKPDMEKISALSKKYNITGYHVFALGTGETTAFCRNFAPLVGIDEESATGSSSGALGCFLVKNKIINEKVKVQSMMFEQGLEMNAPSRIYVKVINEAAVSSRIEEIYVGGMASDVQKVEVVL